MKALRINNKKLYFTDSISVPKTDAVRNVLVKVLYAGICRTDLSVAYGKISSADNITIGHEFCGVVEEVAPGANTKLKKGEIVSANPMLFGADTNVDCMAGKDTDGCFAEYVTVPASALITLDRNLCNPLGAFIEPIAAAMAPWQRLLETLADITDCEIAVVGSGRIAELTMQVATIMNITSIHKITQVASSYELEPNHFDVIVETDPSDLAVFIESVKRKGTIILKSRAFTPVSIIANELVMREVSIIGARYGDFEKAKELLSKIDTNKLFESETFDLKDYADAFRKASNTNSKKIFFKIG